MRNLIIDSRIREEEYKYLNHYFNIIKLPLSDDVYEEISGHSDIFFANLKDRIVMAPNRTLLSSIAQNSNFEIGHCAVERDYPKDVLYNVCQIGNKIIGSKYTDKSIKPDIVVKQGYTKCSISVTSDNSCITTDRGIAEVLKNSNIDVLYVQEHNIKLLKKDGSISKMQGFIGGATLVFDNKFVLFGDSKYLENKEKILEHLHKYNLELVEFKGLEIYDYGSGIVVSSVVTF